MKFLKRFPYFKQNNSCDCGPTSLRLIARHYGLDYSTEMLRKHCHITKHGGNMLGISEGSPPAPWWGWQMFKVEGSKFKVEG